MSFLILAGDSNERVWSDSGHSLALLLHLHNVEQVHQLRVFGGIGRLGGPGRVFSAALSGLLHVFLQKIFNLIYLLLFRRRAVSKGIESLFGLGSITGLGEKLGLKLVHGRALLLLGEGALQEKLVDVFLLGRRLSVEKVSSVGCTLHQCFCHSPLGLAKKIHHVSLLRLAELSGK